jgi:two-component system NtrC family sensor kinase
MLFAPFSFIILKYLPRQQERMVAKQAETIGNYIEKQAISSILVEDYVSLNELLHLSCAGQKNLDFMFIINNKGMPVASTFEKGVPENLIRACESAAHTKYNYKSFTIKEKPYLVFKKSLLQGELGNLCFGINLKEIHSATKVNFIIILLFLFIVLGITLIGSYLIGKWIGMPLDRLAKFAEKVPHGSIEMVEGKMFSSSETKTLFKAFDRMVRRLKEADQEREEFNQKMLVSERLAAIGTLASGVAHEINNPINGIDACLKRVKKIINDPKKVVEYIDSSQKSLDHMKHVTLQLLDFSKPQKYSFKKLDLNNLIDYAVEITSFRLKKEKIKLIKQFDNRLPMITGDEHHLSQLFVNLILNSIDAMQDGGELTLFTSCNEHNVSAKVKDTGTGITESVKNKIFDPFFSTKEPGKGTGLGLSVSYRIAKEHKGKLEVKSEVGIGTEFALILPVQN